jgi:hypothetical protein
MIIIDMTSSLDDEVLCIFLLVALNYKVTGFLVFKQLGRIKGLVLGLLIEGLRRNAT